MLTCIELDVYDLVDDFLFRKYSYNREDALKDLGWAKDYWLNKREPIPTKRQNKCLACEYRNVCPKQKKY